VDAFDEERNEKGPRKGSDALPEMPVGLVRRYSYSLV
jgi:hypothetical protein